MIWAFLIQNWQELGFIILYTAAVRRFDRWWYVGRKAPKGVTNLNHEKA